MNRRAFLGSLLAAPFAAKLAPSHLLVDATSDFRIGLADPVFYRSQASRKLSDQAIEYLVNPPIIAPSAFTSVRLVPGGIMYVGGPGSPDAGFRRFSLQADREKAAALMVPGVQ